MAERLITGCAIKEVSLNSVIYQSKNIETETKIVNFCLTETESKTENIFETETSSGVDNT